jgi:PDZ domain/C2 domain
MILRTLSTSLLALLLASPLVLGGCPAVYPELGTRTHAIPAGRQLDPPPPPDVRWLKVASATVPEKTRDGRPWAANGKSDPYAKLFVNGKELFRTPVQSNTLTPTWPDGPKGNFKLGSEDKLRVEVWDSNAINDKPICVQDIGKVGEDALLERRIRVTCDAGGDVVILYEEAHAVQGAGLWYELRADAAGVTRMLEGSPAQRAGLEPGDDLLEIGGRKVATMSADEVKSAMNAIPFAGLPLLVKHKEGAVLTLTLKEGPIYPLYDQFGSIE